MVAGTVAELDMNTAWLVVVGTKRTLTFIERAVGADPAGQVAVFEGQEDIEIVSPAATEKACPTVVSLQVWPFVAVTQVSEVAEP